MTTLNGIKLRGNETFTELLKIGKIREKTSLICKAKKCDKFLYSNSSTSNPEYCQDCG